MSPATTIVSVISARAPPGSQHPVTAQHVPAAVAGAPALIRRAVPERRPADVHPHRVERQRRRPPGLAQAQCQVQILAVGRDRLVEAATCSQAARRNAAAAP